MSEESRRKGRNPKNMKAGRKNVGDAKPQSDSGRTSRTAGSNRDFDDSGESRNQAHGHPREERSGNE